MGGPELEIPMKLRRAVSMLALASFAVLSLSGCAVTDSQSADDSKNGGSDVIAYLAGEPINQETIDKLISGDLVKLRQQEFDLREKALKQYVLETLLEAEADKRGTDLAGLMKSEVEEKAPQPSREQVAQYAEQYKTRDPLLRGKEGEQMMMAAAQQVRQQLLANRRNDYVREVMNSADLKVLLDPPRVDVRAPSSEPSIGPEDALVTLVEFSDYQCPYCKRTQPMVDKLLEEFGDEIRFVYRDFPLSFHPEAEPAARAARCAGDQGKYWEYHAHLMNEDGSLQPDDLSRRAEAVGLDMAAYTACYDSGRHAAAVKAGFDDGQAVGVTGTPTFFVNGRMFVGGQPYEDMAAVIREEMDRVRQ